MNTHKKADLEIGDSATTFIRQINNNTNDIELNMENHYTCDVSVCKKQRNLQVFQDFVEYTNHYLENLDNSRINYRDAFGNPELSDRFNNAMLELLAVMEEVADD